MKPSSRVSSAVALATAALLALACSSSDGSPSPQPNPGAGGNADSPDDPEGGAGGDESPGSEGGESSSVSCTTDSECDDTLACTGVERCVDGSCEAGTPPNCAEQQVCTEVDGGTCVYEDQSPWVVYRADDDTPAVIEYYAIKRDLVGKMAPLKISDGVTATMRLHGGDWAPDGRLLSFSVSESGSLRPRTQFVYFGDGAPQPVGDIEGDSVQWSASGRAFVVDNQDQWSIYEYGGEGSFHEVLNRTNEVDLFGFWATTDDFLFSTENATTGLRSIQRAFRDTSGWRTAVLVENLDLYSFDLSPALAELVYTLRTVDGSAGPVYALQWTNGGKPRKIAEDGYVDWSPDGSQFLLKRSVAAGLIQAFWGTGSVYGNTPVRIAKSLGLNWVAFTADSRQVLISEAIYDGRQDVRLLNPHESTDYPWDHITRMGPKDSIYSSPSPGDLIITTSREEVGDAATLRARTLQSRTQYDLDTIAPDEEFRRVSVSAHGSFVAYQKGKDPNYETVYVDLRYRENWGYRPVRVGDGDGRVNVFRFDAAGTGLYYIYERESGARECYFLNLAHQLPRDPVKVSREGRVEGCLPQR